MSYDSKLESYMLRLLYRFPEPNKPNDLWHSMKPFELETIEEAKERWHDCSSLSYKIIIMFMECFKTSLFKAHAEYVDNFLTNNGCNDMPGPLIEIIANYRRLPCLSDFNLRERYDLLTSREDVGNSKISVMEFWIKRQIKTVYSLKELNIKDNRDIKDNKHELKTEIRDKLMPLIDIYCKEFKDIFVMFVPCSTNFNPMWHSKSIIYVYLIYDIDEYWIRISDICSWCYLSLDIPKFSRDSADFY